MFYVSFNLKAVWVTSYEDNAILTTIETWTDGVTALNWGLRPSPLGVISDLTILTWG